MVKHRSTARFRSAAIEPLESRTLLSTSPVVIGYLPDWEFSHFNSINLSALTQINYFAVVASSTGSLGTTSVDGYSFSQLQTLVTAAHAASPRVSVSITIDPSSQFLAIAQSSTATTNFVNNIISFCSTYHLDGVDLDYEPTTGSLTQTQINSYGSLLASLHAATSAKGLVLSAAVQVSTPYIIPQADLSDIDRYLVMDYDLEYNSSAPYSESISYLTGWVNYGVPKADLYMGVPFFGSAGTSWSNSTSEGYSQILSAYAAANGGAYPAANVDTVTVGGNTWGFNGIDTAQQKTQYVIQNGFGGIMIWELGQDYFTSGGTYGAQSLLPAIETTLGAATDTWTGNASTTWNNAGNWNYGVVPVSSTTVTINGGTPTVTSALSGGSISLNGGTLTFANGTGVSTVSSLLIASGASVNLGNNTLLIDYGTNSDPISTIAGYLTSGHASGAWNGNGINSSAAAVNTGYALGYADGKDNVVSGLPSGQIEVKYTLLGDANLDGLVNAADFTILAANFNQ
ncbi:MAG: glycoside hydrolase family 18 protein, partial [Tepidisphaeraceae bacterium]